MTENPAVLYIAFGLLEETSTIKIGRFIYFFSLPRGFAPVVGMLVGERNMQVLRLKEEREEFPERIFTAEDMKGCFDDEELDFDSDD
jgi:hypothetical protein